MNWITSRDAIYGPPCGAIEAVAAQLAPNLMILVKMFGEERERRR